jgi:DNA excision repair protein ERCC-3
MIELLDYSLSNLKRELERLDEYIQELQRERERISIEIEKKLEELKAPPDIDVEELKNFLRNREKYILLHKRADQWWIVVPRFVNLYLGWLEHETPSFRVFAINKYFNWILDLPKEIREKIKAPEPEPFTVSDGFLITPPELQDRAWQKYRKHLTRREGKDKIRIKAGHEFLLIAKIIEEGSLPFVPKPVSEKDLRDWNKIKLRSHQEKAWQQLLKWGAIGIFWPYGAGKSYFGIYLLARITGRKLVVVPTVLLKEQWIKRIRKHIPEFEHEIDVITYAGYEKVRDREYTLTIYDECHRLPANTYIRLSTIRTKYRVGLSGSPFREDGRENYIFALTGYPLGMNWNEFIRQGYVNVPTFKVYIVKDEREKLKKLDELLGIPLKTIIFCDYLELGRKISSKFGIPFVHGGTKNRLEVIRSSSTVVVSRVGDEGISIPDLERVIEVAFLGRSRRQEAQRFGRLMHSQQREPQHIIIMTEREFKEYQRRLYAITERGFRIDIVR